MTNIEAAATLMCGFYLSPLNGRLQIVEGMEEKFQEAVNIAFDVLLERKNKDEK